MSLKKRLLSCLILLLLLGVLLAFGYHRQTAVETGAEIENGHKKIALTFDDGPHPFYTGQLLKGLRERKVRATFFVTGENVEAYPEIIREMYEDGHLIGNHTYSHIQFSSRNEETFRQEIIKTNEAIRKVTGEDTIYVRPPYGSWDKKFEKELNMFPVLWSIDPRDWCSSSVSGIVSHVCREAGENEIILMHDQYKTSVTAALKIVDVLMEEGYEFVTVDELLFD
jgi:peptidoglycan/xylan/chitin deacetylase (PgdA/CDA1 family)